MSATSIIILRYATMQNNSIFCCLEACIRLGNWNQNIQCSKTRYATKI